MVLVADRDPVSGRLLASHLARRGFRATHTTLGREALGLARAGGLRAVVVDVTWTTCRATSWSPSSRRWLRGSTW